MNDFIAKRYVPFKLPGKYCCYLCRDLKDAEEFYKDSSRWNGCGSRCKKCDNYRREWRRGNPGHLFGEAITSLGKSDTKVDDTYSRRQIKKRVQEIKMLDPVPPRWSESDIEILTDAVRNGTSAGDMLQYFPQKTIAMLRAKMGNLKKSLSPVFITIEREAGLKPIVIRQDASEKTMYDAGVLIDRIAEIKNKSRVDVYNAIQKG